MENTLFFENRQNWRSWLEENHDKEAWTWLTFCKKGSSKKGIRLEESVEEAICFGWIDGKLKKVDDTSYIVRFSPRKARAVWSMANKKRAERLIASGQMTRMGLAKINEAKEAGNWDNAYTNRIRDKTPADLRKALIQEPTAWKNFQKFANTYRNMCVGWVVSAKTNETRKKRVEKVVELAKKNKKLISQ